MNTRMLVRTLLLGGAIAGVSATGSAQVGWMQPGVRVWYLGAVDGSGPTSSNAEEAFLIDAVIGTTARVVRHAALSQWGSPQPVQTLTYPVLDQGPCWMHPLRLQTIAQGDYWRDPTQVITVVERPTHTYTTFVSTVLPGKVHLLPVKALFDLKPTRQLVKLSYLINQFSVGNAYFDADTGLLLYHHEMWGSNKMFFMLAEINYDFAGQAAFPEDAGPHTGFRSFVSEQSMGVWNGSVFWGGGSVVIQSLVETRYGAAVEMRVLSSIAAPGWPSGTGEFVMRDENYCAFGAVPVLRRIDATQAGNLLPEAWNPFGEYLWWWLPPGAAGTGTGGGGAQTINVFDVNLAKATDTPLTYAATQNPQWFHFSTLVFDSRGYMTSFSARNPANGLDLKPTDFNFQNLTSVDGPSYFLTVMAPAPGAFAKSSPANASAGVAASPAVLSWGESPGAASYEYCVDTTGDDACDGPWTVTAMRQATLSLVAGTNYYWQVRARTAGGTTLADAGAWWRFSTATASTPVFTDDPPVRGVTPVRATHVAELRSAIDSLRARYALSAIAWTDAAIVSGGTPVRASHVAEARAALAAVYTAAGRTPPVYSTPVLIAGQSVVSAADLSELRAAILAIW